jgi:hypothetical protein
MFPTYTRRDYLTAAFLFLLILACGISDVTV